MASGVAAGDRVGIMSRTRYEWALVDFAIWFAGAVSVPIYETSSPSQVAWNLGDSGAVAAFGESAHHEDIIRQAATSEGLTALQHVWQLEGDGLDEVRAAGAGVSDAELEARRSQASLNDIATIIYTSGTTGRPKGCELTHGNFVELSENALATSLGTIVHEQARTIMFLPLAHVFARFISVLAVAAGVTVAHTPDIKNLLPDLQSYKPTFILAVPRVFEKVYNSALTKAEDGGKGAIFHRAADTAIAFSRARQAGKVGLGPEAQARRVRQARLRQAPRRHGRPGGPCRFRRRPAGRTAGPLLPGHRPADPGRLRPDRNHGARSRSTPRT